MSTISIARSIDLLGRLRLRLLVAGLVAGDDVRELVDEGDEEDDEPDGVAELPGIHIATGMTPCEMSLKH